ncbi:MAG: SGNH/GDSL hydrolase family protein [Acidimicrobiales bacterium]|nr:SGNH/GDSL hydrolase family protein [Acidimicrobiales bacterium]
MSGTNATRIRRRFGVAALAAASFLGATALSGCDPVPPGRYVALGDSYVAGPLIPDQTTDPLGCLRSTNNWPHLVQPRIGTTELVDVSCSGATIDDLYSAQDVTPGPANPAQLDALDSGTTVVTLGIGGNDIGFSDLVKSCGTSWPWEDGCKDDYVSGGVDEVSNRIAAVAPRLDQAIKDIKLRAPNAWVYVVGYPTVLPETGNGCYPLVPVLPSDVGWLRDKVHELNAMIQQVAADNYVAFIDLATPSIGHDFCSSDRWVEGLVPLSTAAPVHPNAEGMAAFADVIAARVHKPQP